MKRTWILLLSVFLIALVGCKEKETVEVPTVSEEIEITQMILDRTDNFPKASIEVQYPQNTGNAGIDADIRSWVQARYTKAIQEFEDSDRYEYMVTYEIDQSSNQYMSVVFTNYVYTGGAHGMTTTDVLTYDLNTGERLGLGDVISDTVLPKIQEKLGLEAIDEGYDNRNTDLFGDPAKMAITSLDKIALTDDGLDFYYDPYEIAPYASGTIVLDIDKDELIKMGVEPKFWD